MGTLYLAALIVGLGTILVQLFLSTTGGDDHADLHADHVGEHAIVPDAAGHSGGPLSFAVVFRLRFWTFALLGFGLLGTLLHFLVRPVPLATLLSSSLVGLISGALAVFTFAKLSQRTTNSGAEASELVGQLGRVLLPRTADGKTKIRLRVRGQLVDYVATTDDLLLEPGNSVLVEEVRGERLHVSAAPAGLTYVEEE